MTVECVNGICHVLDARGKRIPGYSYKLQEDRYAMDVDIDKPDIDESRMSVRFPFADGNRRDGVGDYLEIAGIDTERHRKNPITLFDHGKNIQLPIGLGIDPDSKIYTVEKNLETKQAFINSFFYQGKGVTGLPKQKEYDHAVFCQQLFDLTVKGYVRSGSIGYQVMRGQEIPPDYERGIPKGVHLIQTKMLEASLVVLPANGDTVMARKALGLSQVCGKTLSPYLVKSFSSLVGETNPVVVSGFEETKSTEPELKELEPSRVKELRKKYQKKGISKEQKLMMDDVADSLNLWRDRNKETEVRQWMHRFLQQYPNTSFDELLEETTEQFFSAGPEYEKSMTRQNKSISVRQRNKVIKGFSEITADFDLSSLTIDKQNDFLQEMDKAGFGNPKQGTYASTSPPLLNRPIRRATFSFDIEPAKPGDEQDAVSDAIREVRSIAQKFGVRFIGNSSKSFPGGYGMKSLNGRRGEKIWPFGGGLSATSQRAIESVLSYLTRYGVGKLGSNEGKLRDLARQLSNATSASSALNVLKTIYSTIKATEGAVPKILNEASQSVAMAERMIGTYKSMPSDKADVTPEKARKILHDGTVHGKPLTDKQRRMFGAIAGKKAMPLNSSEEQRQARDLIAEIAEKLQAQYKGSSHLSKATPPPGVLSQIRKWVWDKANWLKQRYGALGAASILAAAAAGATYGGTIGAGIGGSLAIGWAGGHMALIFNEVSRAMRSIKEDMGKKSLHIPPGTPLGRVAKHKPTKLMVLILGSNHGGSDIKLPSGKIVSVPHSELDYFNGSPPKAFSSKGMKRYRDSDDSDYTPEARKRNYNQHMEAREQSKESEKRRGGRKRGLSHTTGYEKDKPVKREAAKKPSGGGTCKRGQTAARSGCTPKSKKYIGMGRYKSIGGISRSQADSEARRVADELVRSIQREIPEESKGFWASAGKISGALANKVQRTITNFLNRKWTQLESRYGPIGARAIIASLATGGGLAAVAGGATAGAIVSSAWAAGVIATAVNEFFVQKDNASKYDAYQKGLNMARNRYKADDEFDEDLEMETPEEDLDMETMAEDEDMDDESPDEDMIMDEDVDMEDELPDEGMDMEEESDEPLGAQILRRIHEDFSLLMDEYDQLRGPLENERVDKLLEKKLSEMSSCLQEVEGLFQKEYQELEQLPSTAPDEEEGEIPEEELEDEGMEDLEEPEEEEKDIDTEDTEGVDAVSDGDEEPSEEDVLEGMEKEKSLFYLDEKSWNAERAKQLRAKYSKKKMCRACKTAGKEACSCNSKKLPKRQKNPALIAAAAQAAPAIAGALSGGEKGMVGEASGFLDETSRTKEWGEEERHKAYHYHKTLDGISQVKAMAEEGQKGIFYGYENGRWAWIDDYNGKPISNQKPRPTTPPPEGWNSQRAKDRFIFVNGKWEDDSLSGPPSGARVTPLKGLKSEVGSEEWRQEEEAEPEHQKEMHEHRKMCKGASDFLKALSAEKAFGDPHREKAAHWHKLLKALTEGEEETEENPEEEPAEEYPEPGEMGEKAEDDEEEKAEVLKKVLEENRKNMEALSAGLNGLAESIG